MQCAILKNLLPPLRTGDDALLVTAEAARLIVEARNKLGIQQKVLASEMGISQSYLCDMEQGNRQWTLGDFNAAKKAMERLA